MYLTILGAVSMHAHCFVFFVEWEEGYSNCGVIFEFGQRCFLGFFLGVMGGVGLASSLLLFCPGWWLGYLWYLGWDTGLLFGAYIYQS